MAVNRAVLFGVVLGFLLAATLASLAIGRVWLPPAALIDGILRPKPNLAWLILTDLRVPRTILALAAGATLGLSGAVLQGLLRNPLAEPALLGVSGGAALGAVIAIYFGLAAAFPLATPLLGIAGALGAGALTFSIGRGGTLTLVLAGAAVSGLASAGLSLALNFAPSPYAAYEITIWLLGSLADRDWNQLALAAPFMLAGCACLAVTGRALDALALGEAQATSLGIDLGRIRLLALAGTALAVGAVTAVTGAVGFIGLVAPHLVRPFVGHQPSRTLLPSALLGATLLLLADIATRLIPTSIELKPGVLTSLVGTPFFFWLVRRLRQNLAMTRLVASTVTVRQGRRDILDRVSLSLEPGMFVGLLGANGAGKSTLLAVLAGLLAADGGTVTLDGRSLASFGGRALAKVRAYLPQGPRAEWPISVERLVALGPHAATSGVRWPSAGAPTKGRSRNRALRPRRAT